jgi:acyl-homoserine lactone acylase PvdQ
LYGEPWPAPDASRTRLIFSNLPIGGRIMRITRRRRMQRIGKVEFETARTEDGVVRIWAADQNGLATALGAVHAHDRWVQMVLTRLVGQGRLCEYLSDTATTFGSMSSCARWVFTGRPIGRSRI